jgi:hypothetical protein
MVVMVLRFLVEEETRMSKKTLIQGAVYIFFGSLFFWMFSHPSGPWG